MSNCTDIESVQWTEPENLISLAFLAFINVLVIAGNCLVIAAVFCSHKLRSVTNFFIVSLAVADLLVGIAVLPFSATREIFKVSPRLFITFSLSSFLIFVGRSSGASFPYFFSSFHFSINTQSMGIENPITFAARRGKSAVNEKCCRADLERQFICNART